MPVEVNNGGLTFALTADTSSFAKGIDKALKDANKEIEQLENNLLKAGTSGSKAFEKMFEHALKLTDDIAPLIEKGLSGISPANLEKLNRSLSTTNSEFEILNKTIAFIEENLNDLNLNPQELEQLTAAINQIKAAFEGLDEKQRTTLTQIRNLKDVLSKQSPSDSLFGDTLKQATALQEKIKNVQTELKLSSSNAPGLIATGQAVRGLVAGFQALQGTMALLSGENEDLDKTIKTLVASMSVLQGISEVMEVLDKNSALNVFLTAKSREAAAAATTQQVVATESLAAAEGTQAVATEGAAVAQEGLNTAMKLNPAGLLIAGLTAVVAAIQFFTSETKDAIKEQTNLNKALLDIERTAETLRQKLISATPDSKELDALVKRAEAMRASGKSQAELLVLEEQIATKRKEIAEKQLLIWDNEKDRFENRIDLFQDANKAILNELVSQKSQIESLDIKIAGLGDGKEKERLEKQRAYLQSAYDLNVDGYDKTLQAVEDYYSSVEDAANATRDKEKFISEQSLKSATAFAEARVLLSKRATKAELDAEIQAIKTRNKELLANPDLTAGEIQKILAQQQRDIKEAQDRFKVIQLNDQKALLQSQLNIVKKGTAEELQLRIDLIHKTAEIELIESGITQAQITQIKSNAAKNEAELTRKFNQDVLQAELETAISITKAKLAAVTEGSKEELDFRLDLLDQQAQVQILQAKEQLTNEEQLQAKITEILAQALAARKDLQADHVKTVLAKQFEELDRQTAKLNDPLQKILSNPRLSGNAKYAAQLKINQNEIDEMRKKQELLAEQIVLGTGDVKGMVKAWEDLQDAINKVNNATDNLKKKKFIEDLKELAHDLSGASSGLAALATSLKEVNPELSALFQNFSDVAAIGGNIATSFAAFSTGDVGAGIQSASQAIQGIVDGFTKAAKSAKEAKKEILEFNKLLIIGEEEYSQLLRERERDEVRAHKLKLQGLQDEKKLLEEQRQVALQAYNDVLKKLQQENFIVNLGSKKTGGSGALGAIGALLGFGKRSEVTQELASLAGKTFEEMEKLFTSGQLTDAAKALFEQLRKIKQEGVDIDKLLEQNKIEAQELFTGTSADSITDSIIEGFREGKRSAADFASDFRVLMQQAMLAALKFKYLEGPLQKFFEDFAAASESDGQLTSPEIDRLKSLYNSIIENAANQFDQLQDIAGLNFNTNLGNQNTLTGAIRGMTEQQAELLAGQFGGVRISIIEQNRIAMQHLNVLSNIEINTATLHDVRRILARIEMNGLKVI